jgi:hypothetical protein
MKHPVEHFLVAAIGAVSSVIMPLFSGVMTYAAVPVAQAAPPAAFVWNTAFFLDMLVIFVLGLIGGLLSIVGLPIPVRTFKEGCVRVLVAGAVAAVATGLMLSYLPVDGGNPAVRCGVGALMGFLSYPLIRLVGERGVGWLMKYLKVPEDKTGGDRP